MKCSSKLKLNWGIKLPDGYIEIYEKKKEKNFISVEGRYHIYEYDDISEVKEALEWREGKDEDFENFMLESLEELNISKRYFPDLTDNYKYYVAEKSNLSKLYIIFTEKYKVINIVEKFS